MIIKCTRITIVTWFSFMKSNNSLEHILCIKNDILSQQNNLLTSDGLLSFNQKFFHVSFALSYQLVCIPLDGCLNFVT